MNARDFRAMPQPPGEIFENAPDGMNPSTVLAVWFTAFADGTNGAQNRELDDERLTAIYDSGYTAGNLDLEARSALKRAEPLENPLQGLSMESLLDPRGESTPPQSGGPGAEGIESPAPEEGRTDYPSIPVPEFVKQMVEQAREQVGEQPPARSGKVSEFLDRADWYARRWDSVTDTAFKVAVGAAAIALAFRASR